MVRYAKDDMDKYNEILSRRRFLKNIVGKAGDALLAAGTFGVISYLVGDGVSESAYKGVSKAQQETGKFDVKVYNANAIAIDLAPGLHRPLLDAQKIEYIVKRGFERVNPHSRSQWSRLALEILTPERYGLIKGMEKKCERIYTDKILKLNEAKDFEELAKNVVERGGLLLVPDL